MTVCLAGAIPGWKKTVLVARTPGTEIILTPDLSAADRFGFLSL